MELRHGASQLISHPKCRAVLGAHFPAIVEPRSRDVGVAEPLLDFGDVGLMGEGVGCRRGAQRVDA
jgi:hypothetical protein